MRLYKHKRNKWRVEQLKVELWRCVNDHSKEMRKSLKSRWSTFFVSFTFACVIEGQTAPPQLMASIALILKTFRDFFFLNAAFS